MDFPDLWFKKKKNLTNLKTSVLARIHQMFNPVLIRHSLIAAKKLIFLIIFISLIFKRNLWTIKKSEQKKLI